MFPDKSSMLNQIRSAIKQKWNRDCPACPPDDGKAKPETGSISQIRDKVLSSLSRNSAALKKMEERIEALECMNDQLLFFISFLMENLPDIVSGSLEDSWLNEQKTREYDQGAAGGAEDVFSGFAGSENQPLPTPREKDVLELLAKGLCAKEIAQHLFISESTVVTHKKNLKEKFQARNTMELISKAQVGAADKRKKTLP